MNGVVLDNGDFIHLGPHGAAELALRIGQAITALGQVTPLPGGHEMIEHPERINGKQLEKPHPPKAEPPERPGKGPRKNHKKPPKKGHRKGKGHEHHKHHKKTPAEKDD